MQAVGSIIMIKKITENVSFAPAGSPYEIAGSASQPALAVKSSYRIEKKRIIVFECDSGTFRTGNVRRRPDALKEGGKRKI
jgi:hypothetical protein